MAKKNEYGLTKNQQIFVDEYLIDLNGTRAYKEAYKRCKSDNTARTTASRLLANANIKGYIKIIMGKKDKLRVADQDEVLEFLTSTMRGEYKEEIPIGRGEGYQELTKKELQPKDRIKAAELLGKRYGLYIDKSEISGAVGVTIVDDIPKEE